MQYVEDIDTLKKQIREFENKIQTQNNTIENLENTCNDLSSINDENKLDNNINKKENINHNNLTMKFNSFESAIENNNYDKKQIIDLFSDLKKDLINCYQNKNKSIKNILNKNIIIENLNFNLENQVKKYENENNKGKLCKHCHLMFTPKINDDVYSIII